MDLVQILTTILIVCTAFGVVFLVCELSQRICDYFNSIDMMIGKWNWYLLPIEIQRILPLILIVVQQPFKFIGFGSVSCSRETFKKVSIIINKKSFIDSNNNIVIITTIIFRLSIKAIRTLRYFAILPNEKFTNRIYTTILLMHNNQQTRKSFQLQIDNSI